MREPADAVTGILAFDRQLQQLNHQAWSAPSMREIRNKVAAWERFYRRILPVRQRVFVASFRDVTRDFATVSQRFIERVERDWQPYDPREVPEEKLLGESFHVGPNEDREKIKYVVRQSVIEFSQLGGLDQSMKLFDEIGGRLTKTLLDEAPIACPSWLVRFSKHAAICAHDRRRNASA